MKIDVARVAKLANIPLKPNEKNRLKRQLSDILFYVEKLKEVDRGTAGETSQVTGLENITRDDESTLSLTQEEALSNTKSEHNGLFKVKKILEQ